MISHSSGVLTVLNAQTGNWSNVYPQTAHSFGIYECSEDTTITLSGGKTNLTIVTGDSWDDDIYGGFTTIDIVTTGTYKLVVRG